MGYTPLGIAAELYDSFGIRSELWQFLEEKLGKPNPKGKSYDLLRSLANKRTIINPDYSYLSRIYTTNYDLSIEKALGEEMAETVTIDNQSALSSHKHSPVLVVHLNGAIGHNNAIVIMEQDELQWLTEGSINTLPQLVLRGDLATKTLVFVGYSLQDIGVRFLHYLVRRWSGDSQRTHYVVRPSHGNEHNEGAEALWELHREIWEHRKVVLLDLKAEDFFNRLDKQVQLIDEDDLVQIVMQDYSLSSPAAARDMACRYQERFSLSTTKLALELLHEAA